jgi:Asp-tRNA(Asn)/Glu-tRNA(Gln) amidotransferase C subunit
MAQVATSVAAAGGNESNLREDTPDPCNIIAAVMDNAPDAVKPFFRVPKVIER